jgi:hypothetical protein
MKRHSATTDFPNSILSLAANNFHPGRYTQRLSQAFDLAVTYIGFWPG